MHEELHRLLLDMGEPRIAVLGDMMLDTYVWGQVGRVSPEGPIPVLRVDRREHRPGGAAGVGAMLQALGAHVSCVGTVGDDPAADELKNELNALGIATEGLVTCEDRPTTLKTRYLGYVHSAGRGMQQIVRVDEEVTDPIPDPVAEGVLDFMEGECTHPDLVLIQDMAKGLLDAELLQGVIELCHQSRIPVIVDPERGEDYEAYRGATCLLPNRLEAESATGRSLRCEADYRAAAAQLVEKLNLDAVIITLDREGMFYMTARGEEQHVTTRPRSVLDVTGAGDMVAAVLGLAIGSGTTLERAVPLANVAAGLEVSRQGASSISRAELMAELEAESSPALRKIKGRDELRRLLSDCRKRGDTVAFTNGVFDLLHLGHVELIRFASRQADILVVAVNSDESTRKGKGEGRPIVPEDVRARTLASFPNVDYVVIFEEKSVLPLVKEVRPDVIVKGGDYGKKGVVGWEFVESYGGQVMVSPEVEGLSTTEIIRRIGNDKRH